MSTKENIKARIADDFARIDERSQKIRARFPHLHDATVLEIAMKEKSWIGEEWIKIAARITEQHYS